MRVYFHTIHERRTAGRKHGSSDSIPNPIPPPMQPDPIKSEVPNPDMKQGSQSSSVHRERGNQPSQAQDLSDLLALRFHIHDLEKARVTQESQKT